MTALDRYQLLEGSGLWAGGDGAQRRDVVVRFGKATLVIVDGRSDKILSHWSLAAIRRLNPGVVPARFVPVEIGASRPDESLEIEDPVLLEAIDTVLDALQTPRRPWLRGRRVLAVALAVGMVVAALAWLPEVLLRYTANVVPMAKRAEIGRMVLNDAQTSTGLRLCAPGTAAVALDRLRGAVFEAQRTLVVFADAPAQTPETLHLPGRIVLVNETLLARIDGPEALAGHLLAEAERATANDPLQPVLRHVGMGATLRLLTQGELAAARVRGYGAVWHTTPPAPVDPQAMQTRFDRTGIDPTAWITSLPAQHQSRFADSLVVPLAARPGPVLADSDWLRIQNVCEN